MFEFLRQFITQLQANLKVLPLSRKLLIIGIGLYFLFGT
jgi:hypothetical protein